MALPVAWALSGCGDPDSSVVCGAGSKESIFARSLSDSQLETLYKDSMELLASADLRREYEGDSGHSSIPEQFAYLNARRIRTLSPAVAGDNSYVSFLLKGCMDEFIHLSVDRNEVALSYGLGGAPNSAVEILWSASKKSSLKAVAAHAAQEKTVAVSFEVPGKPPLLVEVAMSEVVQLTGVKQAYAVEFWVLGALSKGEMKYTLEHVEGKRTITAIGGVRNSPSGAWVYFVDGVRSKDHINIQDAPEIRSVRFVFEKARGA